MQTMIRAGMAAVMLAVGLPLAAQSEEPAGILVTAVDPDGPAAAAGIERGDLILSVDGQAVTTTGGLTEALAAAEDAEVTLAIKHGDEVHDLTVQLDQIWGRPRLGVMVIGAERPDADFGMRGERAPRDRTFRFEGMPSMPGVILMEVVPDSPAAGAGLLAGDWITAVDGAEVGGAGGNLVEIIGGYEPGDEITVDFQRSGEEMSASITLGANPDTGSPLLGVRFQPLPFFGRGGFDRGDSGRGFGFGDLDREQLDELRRMLEEQFEEYRRSAPEAAPPRDEFDHRRAL